MTKKKLKSFTIYEMLIAMSISAIVITILFFFTDNISKTALANLSLNEKQNQEQLFLHYLKYNMKDATWVKTTNDANRLYFKMENKFISYHFKPNVIVREQVGFTDTLNSPVGLSVPKTGASLSKTETCA